MRCPHCDDTGSLSKDLLGNLDCGYCGTAQERAQLEIWLWKKRGTCEIEYADATDAWLIYLHGKQAGATEVARTGA